MEAELQIKKKKVRQIERMFNQAVARLSEKEPPQPWHKLMIRRVSEFLILHWRDTERVMSAQEFFEASRTWLQMRTMSGDGYMSFALMQPEGFFGFLDIDPNEPRVKSQIRATWLMLFPQGELDRLASLWKWLGYKTSPEMFFVKLKAEMLKKAKTPYECHLIDQIDPEILFQEVGINPAERPGVVRLIEYSTIDKAAAYKREKSRMREAYQRKKLIKADANP